MSEEEIRALVQSAVQSAIREERARIANAVRRFGLTPAMEWGEFDVVRTIERLQEGIACAIETPDGEEDDDKA